jgi:hypothetical protein
VGFGANDLLAQAEWLVRELRAILHIARGVCPSYRRVSKVSGPQQQRYRADRSQPLRLSATAELTGGQSSTTPIPLYYRLKTLLTEETLSGVYETDGPCPPSKSCARGSA